MSDYRVPYTQILNVQPHPNADKLDICTVYGFQVITQRNSYKIGDRALYIPIDSILPPNLEAHLFPADSKVKLSKSRVRQIRLRGLASQGMLVAADSFFGRTSWKLEEDYSVELNIQKYEPPTKGSAQTIGKDKAKGKKKDHPLFLKYNGLDNIKWFPSLFLEGDQVVVQEKLHGTNARASLLPHVPVGLLGRLRKWLGLAPKYDRVYGSNNVQISGKKVSGNAYYATDVYGQAFGDIDVFSKLQPGETVYGEIIGEGIQANYSYGHSRPVFVLFDVRVYRNGQFSYLNPEMAAQYARDRGFLFVPVLHTGVYQQGQIGLLSSGPSVYCPAQKVREGIVIKSRNKYSVENTGAICSKMALKWINEVYLDDKSNTDGH